MKKAQRQLRINEDYEEYEKELLEIWGDQDTKEAG